MCARPCSTECVHAHAACCAHCSQRICRRFVLRSTYAAAAASLCLFGMPPAAHISEWQIAQQAAAVSTCCKVQELTLRCAAAARVCAFPVRCCPTAAPGDRYEVRVKYFHPMHFDTSTGRYVLDLPTVVPKVCVWLCRRHAALCCARFAHIGRDGCRLLWPVSLWACCGSTLTPPCWL